MTDDDAIDVEDLVDTLKRGVLLSNVNRPGNGVRVASIGLRLTVVAESSQGSGVRFRVPFVGVEGNVGSSATSRTTHTIELVLEPPPTALAVRAGERDVAQEVAQALEKVRDIVLSAARGKDPWLVRSGKVEIQFGVTRGGGISVGADKTWSRQEAHTLTLELAPADTAPPTLR